jgi:hypothetical protein
MLSILQKLEIEKLAKLCLQDIRNDQDFEEYVNSIFVQNAINLYTEITDSFWQGSTAELVITLFILYCDLEPKYLNRYNTYEIQELGNMLFEQEFNLSYFRENTERIDIAKVIYCWILINKLSNLIIQRIIHGTIPPTKDNLKEFTFFKMQVSALIKNRLDADCQYILSLQYCCEHFSEKYLLSERAAIKASFVLGNIVQLGKMQQSYSRRLKNVKLLFENKVFCTIEHELYALEKLLFEALSAYVSIYMECLKQVKDVEQTVLIVYSHIKVVNSGVIDFLKESLLQIDLCQDLANAFLVDYKADGKWRVNGRILPAELLRDKIDFLSLLLPCLQGKDLVNALRLKLDAEKHFADTLQPSELREYYYFVAWHTVLQGPREPKHNIDYTALKKKEVIDKVEHVEERNNQLVRSHNQHLLEHVDGLLYMYAPSWGRETKPKLDAQPRFSMPRI